jgi:hypothetical protein
MMCCFISRISFNQLDLTQKEIEQSNVSSDQSENDGILGEVGEVTYNFEKADNILNKKN